MCSTVEPILLKSPNSWSVLPREVPDKTCMHESRSEASFSSDELEQGEFRVNQSFMPGEDISSFMHSERTSHDFEEMEDRIITAVKASVLGGNAGKNLMHERTSEIRISDYSIVGKKKTRVCLSPIPGEVGPKEASKNLVSISSDELEEGEIRQDLNDTECSEQLNNPARIHQEVEPCENQLLKKRIEEVYSGRLEELLWRQKAELKEYKIMRRKQKRELTRKYYLDLDQIHAKGIARTVRNRKRKLLKRKFKNLRTVFRQHMKLQFRKFVVMQIEARNREKKIFECWIEKAESGTLEKYFDELPLSETGFKLKKFKFHEPCGTGCSSELGGSAESFEEDMLIDKEEADSQSGSKKLVEFYGPVEPDYGTSATFQPVGQENSTPLVGGAGEVMGTPASQPNDTQMLESPEASEETPASQANDTEILSSKTSETDSRLLTTIQRSGEGGMHRASETPVSQSNKTNAELNEYEDVNGNSPGVVEVGKESRGTGPNCASVPGACSHRCKEIILFGHVLGSAGCHQPASSSDQLPPSNNLASAANPHIITPEAGRTDKAPDNQIESSSQSAELWRQIPMAATATHLEQQNHHPLQTITNPLQPTAVIPPARAESEYLGLSDILLQPQEGSSKNMLRSEMMTLTNLNSLIAQRHEQKTLQLKSACEAEIAKVIQEYGGLIHDAETEFTQCKKNLEMICEKICQHQMLTKEIQEILRKNIVNISDAVTVQPTAIIPPAIVESEYLRLPGVLLQPQEGSSMNVLQSEMITLTNLNGFIAQRHQHKTLQLKSACKTGIAKVQQEYDGLIHDAEAEFTQCKKNLEMISDKICQHQILTKEIREILRKNVVNISDAITGSGLSCLQQSTTESQPQVAQCPASLPTMPFTMALSIPSMGPSSSPAPLQLQQHSGPSSTFPSTVASSPPNTGPSSSPTPLQLQQFSGPSSTLPSASASALPNTDPSLSSTALHLQQLSGPSSTLPSTMALSLPNTRPSSSPTPLQLQQHSGRSLTLSSTTASSLPNTGPSSSRSPRQLRRRPGRPSRMALSPPNMGPSPSPTPLQLQQVSGSLSTLPSTTASSVPNTIPSLSLTSLQSQQLSGPSSALPSPMAPSLPNTGPPSSPTPLQLQQLSGPSSTLPSTAKNLSPPNMGPSSSPTPLGLRRRSGPSSTLSSTMASLLPNMDPSSSRTPLLLRQGSGPSPYLPSTTDSLLPNMGPFSCPTLCQVQQISSPSSALPSTMASMLPNMGPSSSSTPPQLQQLSALSSTMPSTTTSSLPNMGPFSIPTGLSSTVSPSVQPISEAQLFAAVFNSQMRAHSNVVHSAGGLIIRAPAPHLYPSRSLPSRTFRHLGHFPN